MSKIKCNSKNDEFLGNFCFLFYFLYILQMFTKSLYYFFKLTKWFKYKNA